MSKCKCDLQQNNSEMQFLILFPIYCDLSGRNNIINMKCNSYCHSQERQKDLYYSYCHDFRDYDRKIHLLLTH